MGCLHCVRSLVLTVNKATYRLVFVLEACYCLGLGLDTYCLAAINSCRPGLVHTDIIHYVSRRYYLNCSDGGQALVFWRSNPMHPWKTLAPNTVESTKESFAG